MSAPQWHVDFTTPEHAEAVYQRRLAEADAHPDEPCYRNAAEAANPHRNDPAYVDVPEWLMIRAEHGRDW